MEKEKMIKSAKARTSVIALILFIFSTSHLFAQNKVVVVPFGGVDGVPAEEINLHHMWSGSVFGDGAIRQAGLYTFTRSSTGTYNVSLDVTGFDIPSTVNSQSNFPIPTAIIEFGDPGDSIRIGGRSVGSTSGIVTSASFSVYTYTSANVLADKKLSSLRKRVEE